MLSGGVDVADEPVSVVRGNRRAADGLADSTIVSRHLILERQAIW